MVRKILVVDDSVVNRQILRRILSDEYEVVEAENGREALDILATEHQHISAILLDIVMPVMDGYDVLDKLRDDEALSPIPVVVTTGNTDGDSEIRALTLGANDFVTKPYNARVIKRRIQNLINLRETAATINAMMRDKLTGLYSREAFFDKAAEMIAEKPDGYYIIACFNVDGFKVINDQYGNEKGDRVLRHIATTFQNGFADMGGLCCRVTADNFAVIYPSKYKDTAELAKIRAAAATPGEALPPLTFSVGRYTVSDRTLSVSAMYDRASIAESSVRGRYDTHIAEYDEAMRSELLNEQRITNEMKGALESEQFEVWYQPQYNHFSGALIGAEALVRWRHPAHGLVSPAEFIPVFERNGFIYELDKFVWERVCMALREWLDEGREPLPVSVNISRYDVFRADLIDVVTGLTERYRLPVELLRVEITETAFAKSPEQIVSVVKSFIERGFTVEIDDFGSGYSSLNTLKDVPAQVIKLDVRFLENNDNSQRGGNIIESVVRMAKWLGMSVIAEGVETAAQADYLKSIGCNYVQGYLYARPMTRGDYEALARDVAKEEKFMTLQTVENLNNNAFWNPESMDTLIFNSYVGCACIFEYHNDRIELLRATEKYARMIGSAGMTIPDALKLDWSAHMDEHGRAKLREAVELSQRDKDEVIGEFVFHDLPACPKETYLRSTLRVIAVAGDRRLIYCINENITAQRQAERKERELSTRLESIMANISCGVCASVLDGKGGIQVLFANDTYYAMLGYTREQLERELGSPVDAVLPEDREQALQTVREAMRTGESIVQTVRCKKRDGSLMYERCINSVTTIEGVEQPVLLAVVDDITSEVLAVERLHDTDEQLRYLNDVSRRLLASDDADAAIRDVLKESLAFFDADRAFILELDDKNRLIRGTYEACATGLADGAPGLQDIAYDAVPYWLNALRDDGSIMITDVAALGDSRASERDMLAAQGIGSLAAVGFKRDGKPFGLIGVQQPKRHTGDISHLRAIGDYVAVILTRRDLNARIASDQQNILGLMRDTPGGFMRMRVLPDGGMLPVYINEGYCRMLGMPHDEILRHYEAEGALWGVHPGDRAMVRENTHRLLATNETRGVKFRRRRADGSYLWLSVFGRVSRDETGDRYMNIYYAEVTEQERRDLTIRETTPFILQAIMNASNDLTFAKDRDLRYLCCSPAFARFAGQEDESGVIGKTDFALFSQSVAEQFRRDDLKLFASGEPLIDYLEPIPSDDNIVHYSSTSKHILRDTAGEIIGLYGVGRDVTQSRTAFEQLNLLADSIPGGLATYAVNEQGVKLLYFNDGFCRILGSTREQYERMSQDSFTSVTCEEDIPMLMAQIDRLVKHDIPIDCDYRVRNLSDNRLKWVNLRTSRGDRRGETTYVHAVLYDIDNVKEAEEEARRSRERMQLSKRLVDESSSAVYVCDTETYEMLYINQRCADMCVRSIDDASAMPCYKFLKGVDQPCDNCIMTIAKEDSYTEQMFDSAANGRHYVARGRIIDWDGRRALVEYLSDETERIDMQLQLETSHRGMEIASLNCGVTFWQLDIDKRELRWGAYSKTNYMNYPDVLEDVPRSLIENGGVHPDDVEICRRIYDELYAGAASCEATLRLLNMNTGEFLWHHVVYTRFDDAPGGRKLAIGFAQNVEKQQETNARYEHERQLRRELTRDCVVSFELNLVTRVISEYRSTFENAMGMPPPDVMTDELEQTLLARIAERDREAVRDTLFASGLLAAYERGQTSAELLYRCELSDVGMRWIRATASMAKRPDTGEIEAFLGFYDVDTQTRDRQAIDSIIDEEIDCVTLLDPRTGVARLVKADTDMCGHVLGEAYRHDLRLREMVGTVVAPEDRAAYERFLQPANLVEALSERASTSLGFSRLSESGGMRRKRLTAYYLDDERNHIVISRRDMTELYEEEKRQKQALMRAAEAANNANAAKSEFLSRMSHDMRTPMNAIMGMVELAKNERDPAVVAEYLDNINASGGFLLGLMNDVLDLSNLESGRIELHEQPVRKSDFVRSILTVIRPLVKAKKQHLTLDLSEGVDCVMADKLRFVQLFYNLLTNAIKFTPEGGRVELSCKRIPGKGGKQGMRFYVCDNGAGMSEEFQRIMYEPFTQEERAGQGERQGTGLGLAIVKNLVDAMGGEIRVKSAPGKGTEFELDLYANEIDDPSAIVAGEGDTSPLEGLNALLVEDNPLNVIVAKRLLERKGCNVTVAGNGQEAVEQFGRSPVGHYGVVLMDLRMPIMDGLQATSLIRAMEREDAKTTPIIAMTADAFDGDRERTLAAGMDAHIVKPVDKLILYDTLTRLIRR